MALPYRLYDGDPGWAPMLRRDARDLVDPRRNPFYEHADLELFLARRGRRVVGRVGAIVNRRHNEVHADRVGFFGFFECEDDAEAAAALLQAAEGWLRDRGCDAMRGPVSPSMNDEAGLLVEGFETPAALMMPHNPPRYAGLLEAHGLARARDLYAYQTWEHGVPERLIAGARRVQERYGVRVRSLDKKRIAAELARVKQVYNAAWEHNWGFVPFTDREMEHLAKQLLPVVDPALALFAEVDGQTVGVAVALPDLNVALRKNPSGRLFPGILKVLWAARRIDRVRVIILGALPEWHRRGLDALLYARIWENGRARGVRWAEAGWVLEDNPLMRNALVRMGFEPYKTYRVYEKAIGRG
ncbi:MAG: N-acetyltransferase [Vicinamibacteria bacterium]|nr:N-acetyltransferase [Vicinamibacteria bacterium]